MHTLKDGVEEEARGLALEVALGGEQLRQRREAALLTEALARRVVWAT